MSKISMDLTVVNARELREMILIALGARLTPYVTSSPGLGKSSIISQISDEKNCVMIDFRISSADPTDMNGYPVIVDGKPMILPFNEIFPTEDMPLPKVMVDDVEVTKKGWIINMDELSSGNPSLQAAAYKVILDRKVGNKNLHPAVHIVAAGNSLDDRAVVFPMSTALQSRMIHLELKADINIWTEDVALVHDYDSRIVAYLNAYPQHLMAFDPHHDDKTYRCPRTWEFLNRILKVTEPRNIDLKRITPLIAGTISNAGATDFLAFCDNLGKVTPVDAVLRDPSGAPIPQEHQYQWASVLSLVQHVSADTIGAIHTYVQRMTLPMQIVFYRMMIRKAPELAATPEFSEGMRIIGSNV